MMFNFFVNDTDRHNDCYYITGSDYNHIKNVLRMKSGDKFLVSENGKSSLCILESLENETAIAKIIDSDYNNTELPVKIYLFQGLPKSDKMELIIQKAVELGVHCIVPVEMNRCVVKLDAKKKSSKVSRWQAISESAAKQSKRNIIPEITEVLNFSAALEKAKELDLVLIAYENKDGMKATSDALKQIKKGSSIGIFIGPEGGFEEDEVSTVTKAGGITVSLGKRILRTETAALTAVGMCMLYTEMNIDGESQ